MQYASVVNACKLIMYTSKLNVSYVQTMKETSYVMQILQHDAFFLVLS